MAVPVLAMVGASLAGSALSFLGGQQTNSSNETIAKDATSANMIEAQRNREFQQTSADKEMAFQKDMSNTAHQREVADLRAAGINPIVSAMGNGSSTPPGASASGSQGSAATATMQNPIPTGFVTSALDAYRTVKDIEKQDAEVGLIKSQTSKTGTDERIAKKGIPRAELTNDFYDLIKPGVKAAKKKIQEMFQNSPKKNPDNKWENRFKLP